jgi:hypothetical protein
MFHSFASVVGEKSLLHSKPLDKRLLTDTLGFSAKGLACRGHIMSEEIFFRPLIGYLSRVPGITGKIGFETSDHGLWWVKFTIDIEQATQGQTLRRRR